jgi:hypothetical protein
LYLAQIVILVSHLKSGLLHPSHGLLEANHVGIKLQFEVKWIWAVATSDGIGETYEEVLLARFYGWSNGLGRPLPRQLLIWRHVRTTRRRPRW